VTRAQLFYVVGGLLVTFLAGMVAAQAITDEAKGTVVSQPTVNEPEADPVGTATPVVVAQTPLPIETEESTEPPPPSTEAPADTPTTSPSPTSSPAPPPVVVALSPPPQFPGALAIAQQLAPMIELPSDCGLPLDVAVSLPNSPRAYRSGTHAGIDFICLERGRSAVAAMGGRVVMAMGDYQDPTPADRSEVLGVAAQAGRTPFWTLAMLYGNFVVLDHGVIEGIGHVLSIYAHLESLDPAMSPGAQVARGQRLGEIGNRGTEPSATGVDDPRSLHLHWEIHIDDTYLGAGLTAEETREIYGVLFG